MTKKKEQNPINKVVPITNKPLEKKIEIVRKGISTKIILCIFLGILSFLVYANTLSNGYAGDDDLFISYNRFVNMGVSGIPTLLTTPHMQGVVTEANDTYRPLALVMFAVENELFGNNPVTGHLINILLFLGCVIMLFLFFDKLMEQQKTAVAFIASLLFAVHPVHTEVVANIKSRDELLCFFFAFWSVNSFLAFFEDRKNIRLIIGGLGLFLSLLSKETSISFLIVIPLIFFFYRSGNRKHSIKIVAVTVITLTAFLFIRSIILKGTLPFDNETAIPFIHNQLVSAPTGASRLATAVLCCGYYVKLLFFPYPLVSSYSFSTIPFASFDEIWVLLSLVLYLFLSIYGLYRLVKFKNDMLAFGILFYLVTIALFSNVFFLIPAILAERFLFFASVGFCLLIALFIEKLSSSSIKQENGVHRLSILTNTRALLLLVPVVIIFVSITISRNKDWENDYVLYKADIENAPENAGLHRNMGVLLSNNLGNENLRSDVKSRMLEKAIGYFERAIAIYPNYADAYAGLSQLYIRKNMFDLAEAYAKKAILLDSSNSKVLDCLGVINFERSKFSDAIIYFKKITQLRPDIPGNYRNIGLSYLRMHKFDSAIVNFKEEMNVPQENYTPIYEVIAKSYREMGKVDSAIKYEQLIRR
ncbi:MAG: tetratricopeptide repeat protein [Flavipsychrobacter sp.]|jgi:tetratricopeptide (TPR) repeat protein|nr:tetratricopeptide repeat protein [Flavipsychrobacter sp.]